MRDRSEFDDLAPLIKLIRAHPPFDRETELKVTRRARKGDKRAQEQLVVHNLSLVISVARKFMGRGVRLEDLVQEGNYGLLKAIEHFDPEKGNRFSTYAVWWIRAYITRCLKDGPSAVRRTMPNGGLPPRDISLEGTLGTDGDSDATHLDRLADEGPGPDAPLLPAEQNEDVRNALRRGRQRASLPRWKPAPRPARTGPRRSGSHARAAAPAFRRGRPWPASCARSISSARTAG